MNNIVKTKQVIKNRPINIKVTSEMLKELIHSITVIAEIKI